MARIALPAGDQPDVVKALMLRPGLAVGVAAMNDAVNSSTLDWRLHELVRMRVAVINGCQTCLTWRTPEAIDAGVTEELLAGVADWRTSALYRDSERVALEFTEQFCGDSAAIDDELLARLGAHFDPGQIVDLTLVIGKYLSQGRFMQVLGLDQACVVPVVAMES
ncbi:MAG TPA: carboxymuconolactone decarboxylase family protein [Mycobacteriales bacterium]|nr:carboxymuconolactone decarboxylase family protein [Mycobacteriales bacterium]